MQKSELLQTMKQKAEAVQAFVSYVKDYGEAFDYTVDLTHKQGGKTVAAPGWKLEEQGALRAVQNEGA